MTQVRNPPATYSWDQLVASAEYLEALHSLPHAERKDFRDRVETSYKRLAGLDGAIRITVDDLRRAAGIAGADDFLGASDLGALGIAPDAQGLLLKVLNRELGHDAGRVNLRIATDVAQTAPGQLSANEGLGTAVNLGAPGKVATAMQSIPENEQRRYYDTFVAGSGTSFEDWQRQQHSAIADATRMGGNLPGFRTSDPEHIRRLQRLGYAVVNAETTGAVTQPPVESPPTRENVRGGNDFFELGGYDLSPTARERLRAQVQSVRDRGATVSGVAIEASTDKVRVTPKLRERLDAFLKENGASALDDARDPTGNQRLAQARALSVRNFLMTDTATQLPATAFAAPVAKADQSTTGATEDADSRYIDVGFDTVAPGARTPGTETPGTTTYTMARPPRSPGITVTDHIAFAVDVSGSIDKRERTLALQAQLHALERGNFGNVNYQVVTFSHAGKPSPPSRFSGSPTEVVRQVADHLGINMSVDEIRAFVHNSGPTKADDDHNEPLGELITVLQQWERETRAQGHNPTVIISTDVDPGRTRNLRNAKFLVANPAETNRTPH